jgi:hypothetical protein
VTRSGKKKCGVFYCTKSCDGECRVKKKKLDSVTRGRLNKEGLTERRLMCYSLFFNRSDPFNYFNRSNGIFSMVHR